MKNFRENLAASGRIVKIFAKTEPTYFGWSVPQTAVSAVLPLLYVYAPKRILERLTDGSPYRAVFTTVLIYMAVLLALNLLNTFFSSKSRLAADRFSKKLRFDIGKMTMRMNLGDVEDPEVRRSVELAKNASGITGTMTILQRLVSCVVTIAGLAYIIQRLDIVFMITIFVVVLAKTLFSVFRLRLFLKRSGQSASNTDVMEYLTRIAYFNPGAEKELRVNNLQNWYMDKILRARQEMVEIQLEDFRFSAKFDAMTAVLVAAQSLLVLYLLSLSYLEGSIGIADFSMYFTAVTTLTSTMASLSEQITNYNRFGVSTAALDEIERLAHADEPAADTEKIEKIGEIIFENVSFIYPNCETPVLTDINIRIRPGEKLVVVGLNGAGKSTFIKLLCKFYRPTTGRITVDGTDIWTIPNERYYRLIAAVFQDYANFAFTIRENVTLTEDTKEDDSIRRILTDLSLNAYSDALDTSVTKNFDPDGVELSGGEAQKLAIARAVYKNCGVMILDEPTASLDARAESEIYEDFFELAKEKTAIFISHRLAASGIADHIAVFEDGRIVEYGTHRELMEDPNGLYAEMYTLQSQPYTNERET